MRLATHLSFLSCLSRGDYKERAGLLRTDGHVSVPAAVRGGRRSTLSGDYLASLEARRDSDSVQILLRDGRKSAHAVHAMKEPNGGRGTAGKEQALRAAGGDTPVYIRIAERLRRRRRVQDTGTATVDADRGPSRRARGAVGRARNRRLS